MLNLCIGVYCYSVTCFSTWHCPCHIRVGLFIVIMCFQRKSFIVHIQIHCTMFWGSLKLYMKNCRMSFNLCIIFILLICRRWLITSAVSTISINTYLTPVGLCQNLAAVDLVNKSFYVVVCLTLHHYGWWKRRWCFNGFHVDDPFEFKRLRYRTILHRLLSLVA